MPVLLIILLLSLSGCQWFSVDSHIGANTEPDAEARTQPTTVRRNGVIFRDGKLLMLNGKALGGPLKLGDGTVVELNGQVTYYDGRTAQMTNGQAIDLKGNIYAGLQEFLQ